ITLIIIMSEEFNSPLLPASGLLKGVSEDDRIALSSYGEFIPVHEGQLLIEEGKQQDALYLVISGLLHVHTDKDNKHTLIARIGTGESIGEINLFDPGTASASVTSQAFSQVWKATRRDFEAFVQTYPEVGEHILVALVGELSRRIRFLNGKLIAMEVSYQELWQS
ncbi:MAG: cyclic nucleotide-binding domain-containing protein, partial [Akkermansiaceae bacterium]|nr:cyclic nucleotide-binding domain-containing protein [Akkermansiaceae bacterium]